MKHSILVSLAVLLFPLAAAAAPPSVEDQFRNPPEGARPWVYWFVANGHLGREGITADFEAMKQAGIGGAIFMEVEAGVPPGPVPVMSPKWQELIRHAAAEAERLGLELALATGPGWTGAGGPWIKPDHAMQHLSASETPVKGPARFDAVLPRPQPHAPFFGIETLTPALSKAWYDYYRDVAVLAFPTPKGNARIADIGEKALYHRAPFSSQPGVKPYLPSPAEYPKLPADQCITSAGIVDLTAKLGPGGRLTWDVPAGDWTIMRFGRTLTGQSTRPAPAAGVGFETGKFETAPFDAHFDAYLRPLLPAAAKGDSPIFVASMPQKSGQSPRSGVTALHFDSWELSAQNWSESFAAEFRKRRGYDPLRYVPAMAGRIVDSLEISERFLWDLRQTAQELVVERHLQRMKELGRRHGLYLSTEPYDLNPCADLTLGGPADVPMCEFWAWGGWFDTTFSCHEAVSIAHTMARPVVAAESFTSGAGEDWRLYPGGMKGQADWALATGINRLTFHCCTHQPGLERRPGMTMGSCGVHWDRTQTWWDMAGAFHRYVTRCQAVLRRGLPTADILYLNAEGAPRVFQPPSSALRPSSQMQRDRKGYNFDGIAPEALIARVAVKDGRLVLPDGMSYRVLVLPEFDTMTPGLLSKIKALVEAGATVVGSPPRKSPSLAGYPRCDAEVQRLSAEIWGKGRVIRSPSSSSDAYASLRDHARWIWGGAGNPAVAAPVGFRYFRTAVEIDPGRKIQSATVLMTADNAFELWINGKPAAAGNDFHRFSIAEVAPLLRPGRNVLAVAANNGDAAPNPAGLIGSLVIRFADGGELRVCTNATWETALAVKDNWKTQPRNSPPDAAWAAARVIGPLGHAPWGLIPRFEGNSGPYASYELVAGVLAKMGVPPDFECDQPLRYTHRRDGDADIYFVSNGQTGGVTADCVFRVSGKQPELWDPLTGEVRPAAAFSQDGGRTTVPLLLEPSGSLFVVFRQPTQTPRAEGKNFPTFAAVREVGGPWTVTFDPKWGGPERPVVFETLTDWTKRPEEGIRHYSGKAMYRNTCELAPPSGGQRMFLEIGRVPGMAEVRMNGKTAGVAWCNPWRVEITGAVRQGKNDLEVVVANLWPNRLIGDAALPPEKRYTWSTYHPYGPKSALFESGLLGPVRVVVEKAK